MRCSPAAGLQGPRSAHFSHHRSHGDSAARARGSCFAASGEVAPGTGSTCARFRGQPWTPRGIAGMLTSDATQLPSRARDRSLAERARVNQRRRSARRVLAISPDRRCRVRIGPASLFAFTNKPPAELPSVSVGRGEMERTVRRGLVRMAAIEARRSADARHFRQGHNCA